MIEETETSRESFPHKDIFAFMRSYWRQLTPGFILSMARTMMIAPFPFFFQIMIDDHVKAANIGGIFALSVVYVGLLLLHYVFAVEGLNAIARVTGNMVMELRSRVFLKLQFLHFGYLDRQKTGRLLSKYAFDTQHVDGVIIGFLSNIFPNLLYSLTMVVLLTILNWQLSLIIIGFLPIIAFSRIYFFKHLEKKNRQLRLAREHLTGTASEYISALRLVRGYGQEKRATGTVETFSGHFTRSRMDQISVNNRFAAFTHGSTQLLSLIVIAGGALLVINQSMTLGTLVAFMAALPIILMPVQLFLQFSQQYFVGKESFHSLRELLNSHYVEEWKGSRRLPNFKGRIDFDQVTFHYDPNESPALRDIDLSITAGEHIALVGPSGSGKSTIANLVLGLYKAQAGQILIDEVPQSQLDMRWLRRNSAIVMQESLMLSGSIMENVRFGRFKASEQEVREACRLANATEFIEKLPKGYETEVGERGVSLSGGQRQRISIARAILRNPRILILDEATSALDYESERLIQEALERLSEGRTVITIAHRLSTVKKADRIIVLSEGRIVEQGPYEQLSHSKGYFQHLLSAQES